MPMRALAVADVYEALTSARPYRPARTPELALELIRSDTPHRLDADAVIALERLLMDPGAMTVTRRPHDGLDPVYHRWEQPGASGCLTDENRPKALASSRA